MGNSTSRGNNTAPPAPPGQNVTAEICLICLQPAPARGGEPLCCPGCCGKWFHQKCVDQLIATGNLSCPSCRHVFNNPPVAVGVAAATVPVTAIPQMQVQQQQFQQQMPLQQLPTYQQNAYVNRRPSTSNNAKYSDAEEVLSEKELANLLNKATENDHNTSANSTITVKCTPEVNELPFSSVNKFCVDVNLQATSVLRSSTKNSEERKPMDLVCILDNSGSMSGGKLESVKEAMSFVRSQLGPRDRLSVINFNSYATVIHGLKKMTDANKELSGSLLGGLTATGGTDIYDGLRAGVDLLGRRQTRNTITSLFLLTDGQDSGRMQEKKDLCRGLRSNGQSLFVFGFGNDHDADQLQQLATAAEGPFSFVQSNEAAADAFGGALGGQQGLVANDIHLRVTVPAEALAAGVRLDSVDAGRYSSTRSADGNSVDVQFANIYLGEQRDILIYLNIPETNPSEDAVDYSICSASATFYDVDGVKGTASAETSNPQRVEGAADAEAKPSAEETGSNTANAAASEFKCTVRRMAAPRPVVNLAVDAQKNRAVLSKAMNDSVAQANSRQMNQARTTLQQAIATIQASPSARAGAEGEAGSVVLIEDLNAALNNVKDETEYYSMGGQATMMETTNMHMTQRCVYNKGSKSAQAYQNASSNIAQEMATKSRAGKKF